MCCLLKYEEQEQVCDNIRTKVLAKSEVPSIIGQFSELDPGDIIRKLKTLSTKTNLNHHKIPVNLSSHTCSVSHQN